VGIATAYPLVLEAFGKLLETDPRIAVIGEAQTTDDALTLARIQSPDVLLLDDAMLATTPVASTLRELSKQAPSVRTLVVTSDDDTGYALDALAHGARGVILKRAPSHLLFKSIYTVSAGSYWVGRDCVDGLIDRLRARDSWPTTGGAAALGLSARELEVVSTIVAGYTNDEIAKALRISVKTVKRHLTSIFSKVGTSNRLELASFAIRNRLASEPPPTPPSAPHRT
jgi:DNA-binding NarL/FixJ family response regulator